MAKKTIVIEGTENTRDAANFRRAFRSLFAKAGCPQLTINISKSYSETIKDYKRVNSDTVKCLLIDSDAPPRNKRKNLKESGDDDLENAFFMVQEMEAWFLSQPDAVKACFSKNLDKLKLPKGKPENIASPKEKLSEALYKCRGQGYDGKRDAITMLENLNTQELENTFEDFKQLVEYLKS